MSQAGRAAVSIPLAACLVAAGWITLALWLAWPVYGYVAVRLYGPGGWWASLWACSACWLAAVLALIAPWWARRWSPVVGVLFGSVFRLLIPLGAAVAGTFLLPGFRDGGGFGIIVAYFLYMLVWETWLMVRLVRAPQPSGNVDRRDG